MASTIPETFKRLVVNQLSTKFEESVSITEENIPILKSTEILVKNHFVGINASDINFSAGRYNPAAKPPFDVGFEGLGEIVSKGADVQLPLNQAVGYMKNGAFSEYVVLDQREAFPITSLKKEYITLLVSGLTAAVSLEKIGEIKRDETVLVTAAAGGTGQFAVQLAKLAGCHVIGTCSSSAKVQLLKELGCDRVINYKEEKLADVLKKEYPKGVDVVYESIGGEIFDTCVDNLGIHGRLIVIGYISGYQSDTGFPESSVTSSLPRRLLRLSASIRGFFLPNHRQDIMPAAARLFSLYESGKLRCQVDCGENTEQGPFLGLDGIYRAVQYMYSMQSIGKVVVELP